MKGAMEAPNSEMIIRVKACGLRRDKYNFAKRKLSSVEISTSEDQSFAKDFNDKNAHNETPGARSTCKNLLI